MAMGRVIMATSALRTWKRKMMMTSADDQTFLDQFFFQSRDRSKYKIRTVVGADDLNAGRKRRLDLFDFLLDAIDQIERVLAVAHDHDAADHFAFAVQLRDAAPHVRPQSHRSDVAHQNRRAASPPTVTLLDVLDGSDIAATAHHVFRAAQFDGAAADVVVAHANGIDHAFHRQPVGGQLVRIEIDLILAHESADAGDFRHAFDAADLIAQIPILKAAQLSQIIFPRLIDQRVLKDPADAAGVRAECRGNATRKAT